MGSVPCFRCFVPSFPSEEESGHMRVDINPIVEPDPPSENFNIETKANTQTGYIKRKTTKHRNKYKTRFNIKINK